jgi:hypothetical protein
MLLIANFARFSRMSESLLRDDDDRVTSTKPFPR